MLGLEPYRLAQRVVLWYSTFLQTFLTLFDVQYGGEPEATRLLRVILLK